MGDHLFYFAAADKGKSLSVPATAPADGYLVSPYFAAGKWPEMNVATAVPSFAAPAGVK